MSERVETIEVVAKELLEHLGVSAKLLVKEGEEGLVLVDIHGENLGALIGYHGEGLAAAQSFLSTALFNQLGEWINLYIDIGGYRKEREEKVRAIAQRTAQKARFLSMPIALSPMPPFERRLVHLVVQQTEGVTSESEGTGWERHVVVKPVGK